MKFWRPGITGLLMAIFATCIVLLISCALGRCVSVLSVALLITSSMVMNSDYNCP